MPYGKINCTEVAYYESLPSSRAEARFLDAPYYFTRKPCAHGHVAARPTKSKVCSECSRIASRNVSPEKAAAYSRAFLDKPGNREARREKTYWRNFFKVLNDPEAERARRRKYWQKVSSAYQALKELGIEV